MTVGCLTPGAIGEVRFGPPWFGDSGVWGASSGTVTVNRDRQPPICDTNSTVKRKTLFVVALAMLLTFSVAACGETTPSIGDVAVVVPNTVGMDYADAKAELEQAGFKVVRVDRPGAGPSGTVKSQKPRPGEIVWPPGRITLAVVTLVVAPSAGD
jgi:PASTA domain-containing protein